MKSTPEKTALEPEAVGSKTPLGFDGQLKRKGNTYGMPKGSRVSAKGIWSSLYYSLYASPLEPSPYWLLNNEQGRVLVWIDWEAGFAEPIVTNRSLPGNDVGTVGAV